MSAEADKSVQRVAALPSPVGRGTNGQFVTGNAGGPGNPQRGKIERLRHQLLEATDPEQVGRIWQRLLDRAELGDHKAIKLVFDRLFGKVAQPIITANSKDGAEHAALMLQTLRGDPELLMKMNEMARMMSERNGANGS